jgi:hypothetical protein
VALFPACQRQRAPVRETKGRNPRLRAALPSVREGRVSGAIFGRFSIEKVPKRYMFGTHLAVNI